MRISSKLVLFALICSILPLLAAFWLSFNAARDSLHETVESTLLDSATEELDSVQRRLSSIKSDMMLFSHQSVMQEILFGGLSGTLQHDLERFAAASGNFAEIAVTDALGIVRVSTDTHAIGADLTGTWEHEAPQLGIEFDGPVVDSYRLDKLISTQAFPIFSDFVDDGEESVIGAVISSISWNALKAPLYGSTVYGGRQGPGRQIVLQSTADDRILYATPGVAVPEALFEPFEGERTFRTLTAEGRERLVATVDSVAIEPFRDPGWRIHVLLDADIAYASVNELREWFILVGAGVLVIASLLAYLLARSITRPVEALVSAAHSLAQGRNDEPLVCTGRDEIGQLSRSFERMRQAVHANERELIDKSDQAEAAPRGSRASSWPT